MTQTTDFLSHLNPSQRQAVAHYNGPMLVVAGAGSGKGFFVGSIAHFSSIAIADLPSTATFTL